MRILIFLLLNIYILKNSIGQTILCGATDSDIQMSNIASCSNGSPTFMKVWLVDIAINDYYQPTIVEIDAPQYGISQYGITINPKLVSNFVKNNSNYHQYIDNNGNFKLRIQFYSGNVFCNRVFVIVNTDFRICVNCATGHFCGNATSVPILGAQPSGGTWSGLNVSNNTLNPSAYTPGSYTLNYSYSYYSGCTHVLPRPISIVDYPQNINFNIIPDTLLEIQNAINITNMSSAGGTWNRRTMNGNGVYLSGGNYWFSPAMSGLGLHYQTVTYRNTLKVFIPPINDSITLYDCVSVGYDSTRVLANPGTPSAPIIDSTVLPNHQSDMLLRTFPFFDIIPTDKYVLAKNNDTIRLKVISQPNLSYKWFKKTNNILTQISSNDSAIFVVPISNTYQVHEFYAQACNFLNCGSMKRIVVFSFPTPNPPILNQREFCIKNSDTLSNFITLDTSKIFNHNYIDNNGNIVNSLYYNYRKYLINDSLFLDSTLIFPVNVTSFKKSYSIKTVDWPKKNKFDLQTWIPSGYSYIENNFSSNFSSAYDTIIVFNKPILNVNATNTNLYEGELVQFISTNQYDSIASYYWEFGDGNISYAKNPYHYYYIGGFKDVYFRATSSVSGCQSDTLLTNFIYVSGNATNEIIENTNIKNFKVYNGAEQIRCVFSEIQNEIQLYNSSGHLIENKTKTNELIIPKNNYSKGLYILKTSNNDIIKLLII